MTEDRFKGDWHPMLGLLCAATCAYNVMRFAATHTLRHAMHVAVYGGMTAWEITRARDHWRA